MEKLLNLRRRRINFLSAFFEHATLLPLYRPPGHLAQQIRLLQLFIAFLEAFVTQPIRRQLITSAPCRHHLSIILHFILIIFYLEYKLN